MRTCLVLLCGLLAGSTLAEDVNILDCGAVPDGTTLATPAIQKAIDRCAAAGGGTVTVPAGRFLTNTVFLKSNVNLHLGQGAVLLGSTEPKAFTQAVVYANGVENASITGPGTIDGQGFKKHYPTNGPRHNDIRLFRSKKITVRDVTLINSPSWVFRILECDGVSVRGVRIYSFANENNDGIDIDGKNITISDCIIDCDDDAVCLKSDNPNYLVENIAIANCVIASNCNAIKFGTSSRCGFRNISIGNCVIRRPSEAAQRHWAATIPGVTRDDTVISGLALEVVDGGAMDQIAITNISMMGVQTPLFIRLGSRNGRGMLRNVVISNITATNESLITSSITGVPGSCVENVTVRDVIFAYKGTGTLAHASAPVPEKEATYPENRMFGPSLPAYGLYARHVKNLIFENFRFNLGAPDARPALLLDDCHNVKLLDFDVAAPSNDQPLVRLIQSTNVILSGYQSITPVAKLVQVEGKASSGIKLTANDLTGVRSVVTLGEGCEESAVKEWNNLR
jgi:polygalacturonase